MCVYYTGRKQQYLINNEIVIINKLKNKTISADTAFFLGDEDTVFFLGDEDTAFFLGET